MSKTTVTDERILAYIERLPLSVTWARAMFLGCDEIDATVELVCTVFGYDKAVTPARVFGIIANR